jgi:hypothetical protein
MKVICEIKLSTFQFWSGGATNAQMLSYNEFEQLESMLDDIYYNGMEESALNDLFWFDFANVCEMLGYTYDEGNGIIIRG